MIKQFKHTCVLVKDLNESLKFYRGILGLKVVRKLNVEGSFPETAYDIKGLKITYVKLSASRDPKNTDGLVELQRWQRPKMLSKKTYSHISFSVDNMELEYRRLKKRGVRFISRPVIAPDGRIKLSFCYDPDNNLIELIEDLRK